MQIKLNAGNNKKFKIDCIQNSAVYTRKSVTKQLPKLYYLILWNSYFKKKII